MAVDGGFGVGRSLEFDCVSGGWSIVVDVDECAILVYFDYLCFGAHCGYKAEEEKEYLFHCCFVVGWVITIAAKLRGMGYSSQSSSGWRIEHCMSVVVSSSAWEVDEARIWVVAILMRVASGRMYAFFIVII